MQIIRQAQMDALSILSRPHTVEKILVVLDRRHHGLLEAGARQSARALLAQALDRAFDQLGCHNESSAADYAGLVYEFGFGFECDVRVAAIFGRTEQSMDLRIYALFKELSDRDWARLRGIGTAASLPISP